ncbi:hypothetical protein [Opitutus terrae]|uniref:Uncharacterized protein n=1 Tax=Opitutus terrae (strain DSM 11246 / JCM 15787 / PB90-1) TaxID=452637 RepID=B1ZZ17_OPITP|nr:hypothetical protein [Opitutus terrae]ACB76338.1 hypothetical protein Oter_3058 [Opitutus terrae PB90-1]
MPLSFWIRRFLTVFTAGFVLLFVVGLMKGRSLRQVTLESALWSAIATSLFIATRLYHLSKGRRCELCQDTPPESGDSSATTRR